MLDGNSRPVLMLLSDGLPTSGEWIVKLEKLRDNAWFKKALRYAVGYHVSSPEAVKVLEAFTNEKKNIIRVFGTKAFYSIIRRVTETTIQERKRFEYNHSKLQGRVFKIVARDIRFIGRSRTNIERRENIEPAAFALSALFAVQRSKNMERITKIEEFTARVKRRCPPLVIKKIWLELLIMKENFGDGGMCEPAVIYILFGKEDIGDFKEKTGRVLEGLMPEITEEIPFGGSPWKHMLYIICDSGEGISVYGKKETIDGLQI